MATLTCAAISYQLASYNQLTCELDEAISSLDARGDDGGLRGGMHDGAKNGSYPESWGALGE